MYCCCLRLVCVLILLTVKNFDFDFDFKVDCLLQQWPRDNKPCRGIILGKHMTKLFMRMSWQTRDGRNYKELQVSKGMKHYLLVTNVQDMSYQLKMKSLRLQGNHGKIHGTHCLIGLNLMRVLGRIFVRLINIGWKICFCKC